MNGRLPHILLVMVDQLAASFLRAYGHPVTKTPTIDRLAEDGVVFTNAYTPSPLCAPARAAFMTGALPTRTGVYDNAAELSSSIPTFAHYLRLEGYRTCLSGKMHFVGADQLHGFEERLTTDVYPGDFGWTPDWRRPDERVDSWYHNMSSVKEAGVAEITNQLEYDDEVAFLAIRRLYDHARYERDAPLFLCVSFSHPHDPYVARPRYWDLYSDEEIDLPAAPARPPAELDAHSLRLWKGSAMDEVEVTEDDVRAVRHGYYASLSYVDEKIGEVLAALGACGLADETIVLFVSDHGDLLGEHGLFYKMSFYENACRVPLVVHAPGRYAPRRVDQPVSLVDFLPTLADLARPGLSNDLACAVDGRSLVPLLEGDPEDPDATVVGEYLAECVPHPMVMIRRGRWKFVHVPGDPDQLFDLESDPRELVNLAEDAGHAGPVTELREEVARRWDLEAVERSVRESQLARLTVFPALQRGKPQPWDFQPSRASAEQYVRNTMDVTERDQQSRFPPAR
ncbi:MAG TPA: choline-sulfatase [Gaiellaceae bacterium]|nr:choline-sulfatase [Gaiellaceae bacterium]